MLIPTLVWWKESILWVSGMSLYALVIGHISSYEAAASAGVDDATHRKLNAVAGGLADVMAVLVLVMPSTPEGNQAATKLKSDLAELRQVVGLEDEEAD